MKDKKLVVILGPTASGKSELALKLAKKFEGEIVSADSRQVYQEIEIGVDKLKTGKIPQHLVDLVKPNKQYTAALYKRKAMKTIKEIQKRGRLPILVGGTGLYISSLINNLKIPKVKPNYELRKKLEKLPKEVLWQMLLGLDKEAGQIVDQNNPRRIIRAIEICQTTGKSLKEERQVGKPLFEILQIGLYPSKEKLYQKINQRVEQMFKKGLVKEVKKLYQKYGEKAPGLKTIGYQEIISYLKNRISLEKAKELIKRNTKIYAKKQIQWFSAHGGRDKRIIWVKNQKEAKELVKTFLKS